MLDNLCPFCRIIKGELPSKKLYEDESFIAIYDINPQAKIHFLLILKSHVKDITAIRNPNIFSQAYEVINKIVKDLPLEDGFRVVTNIGVNGAQSVPHLHFHVLGGEKLLEKIN